LGGQRRLEQAESSRQAQKIRGFFVGATAGDVWGKFNTSLAGVAIGHDSAAANGGLCYSMALEELEPAGCSR
jgi:hypothetical protein